MSETIAFSVKEHEVIMQRFDLLRDEGMLEEVFCETEGFNVSRAANWAESAHGPVFHLSCPEAVEILADCIEGSTFFADLEDNMSPQLRGSYRRAAKAAADRISSFRGAEVRPCLE